MSKIRNIIVKSTHKVGIGGLNAPKIVIDQLQKMYDSSEEVNITSEKYPEAMEWLRDNIKERDCFDMEYEIISLAVK